METMVKVSIIIACYNAELYITEAIDSALNQTYPNIEIICIDDCSTDKSFEKILQYSDHVKIKILKNNKNLGVVESRNIAITNSSGEYILPLDADDKIESSYVEKAVKVLTNTDIGIVYCDANFFGAKSGLWKLPEFNIKTIVLGNCIHSCAMFRKQDFLLVGGYKNYMKEGLEDWDLWLSIIDLYKNSKLRYGVYKIPEVLFWYRKIKTQTRSDSFEESKLILLQNIVCNHTDLYMKDGEVIRRIFEPNEEKTLKKLYKYRKRYQYLIITNITILLFILCKFVV